MSVQVQIHPAERTSQTVRSLAPYEIRYSTPSTGMGIYISPAIANAFPLKGKEKSTNE